MIRILSSLLLLVFLAGCSSNVSRIPVDLPAELTEYEAAIVMKKGWRYSVSADDELYTGLQPLLQQGRLYLAGIDGEVVVLDASSGEKIWRVDLDEALMSGPGIADDLILVGTSNAELIALDKENGAEVWRRKIANEILARPSGEAGVAVYRTIDGHVNAINTATGEDRWQLSRDVPVLTLRGDSAPLIADGRVFLGFANGKLISISLQGGRVLWETEVAEPSGRTEIERVIDLDADLKLVEGVLYSASFQAGMAAVSELSGVVLWRSEASSHAGLDADWREVYISDENGHVTAMEAGNGGILWQQKALQHRRLTPPAIIGDQLVVGDYQGFLHWLARDDGRLLGRLNLGDAPIQQQPIVYDGRIYVQDAFGILHTAESRRLEADEKPKLMKRPEPESHFDL